MQTYDNPAGRNTQKAADKPCKVDVGNPAAKAMKPAAPGSKAKTPAGFAGGEKPGKV